MKIISLFFVLIILAFATGQLQAQPDAPPEVTEYVVTGETVNLRAGPATSFEIVGQANSGDIVLAYAADQTDLEWLRLYRAGQPDAYIARFLVRVAPQRFYPPDQIAEHMIAGSGVGASQVLTFSSDAYRIDVTFQGTAFTLDAFASEGDCGHRNLFDILTRSSESKTVSTWFVPNNCTWYFEVYNATDAWQIETRTLFTEAVFNTMLLPIENGTLLVGYGNSLSMPTMLGPGTWQVAATVDGGSFILEAMIVDGDCDPRQLLFNETRIGVGQLDLITTYEVGPAGCYVYWHTINVDEAWQLDFTTVPTEADSVQ